LLVLNWRASRFHDASGCAARSAAMANRIPISAGVFVRVKGVT
jgi:hypothetical protein